MPHLPDAAAFRGLVDGSRRGATAAALRGLFACCAVPYAAAVAARNTLYDLQWLPIAKPRVPVICVGNLTLGGTGKTPLVAWVARQLAERGQRPAIISRGYAAAQQSTSDEAAELNLLLPAVPHIASRNRAAGVEDAVDRHAATVAVLDDGFQHRRLARSLDIVAVDATDPFGCGHLFPRGLLREPLRGLRRAGGIVLTRASSVDAQQRAAIKTALLRHAGSQEPIWSEAVHRPQCLRSSDGTISPLEELAGRRVAIVSGIGNPAAFRRTVEAAGAHVAVEHIFPDHHPYPAGDAAEVGESARRSEAELVVTTVKDLVKIQAADLSGVPVVALEVALDIIAGEDALQQLISSALTVPAVGSSRTSSCGAFRPLTTPPCPHTHQRRPSR